MAINLGTSTYYPIPYQFQRQIVKTSSGKLVLFALIDEVIKYKTSTDDGATWDTNWIDTGIESVESVSAYIETNNDIYLVYHYADGGCYFVKLTYNSGVWDVGTEVSLWPNVWDAFPTITKRSNGDLFVAIRHWSYVYCKYSADGGITWNDTEDLLVDIYANVCSCAVIPKGDNIWAIVLYEGKITVYEYISSWDSGTDVASDAYTALYTLGVVKISDNNIWVAESTSSGIKVFHYNGSSWDSGTLISDDLKDEHCALSNIDGQPVAVWSDYSDVGYNVAYRRYNGSSWEPQVDVTSDSLTNRGTASIDRDSTTVYFCWPRGSSPYDIMFDKAYLPLATQQTIVSDAQISGLESINSDSQIISFRGSVGVLSDAQIKPPLPKQYIGSNATIKQINIQKLLDSNSFIISNRIGRSIISDTQIKAAPGTRLQNINSASSIKHVITTHIDSTSYVKYAVSFYARTRLYKSYKQKFDVRLRVTQPTPIDPSDLVAADLQTGEAIELTWVDTGNYGYNVYKEVGGNWVKQNSEILVGATSYIVGALVDGVTYTFKVTGVNGVGNESIGVTTNATPTFSLQKYSTKPTWEILIDGVKCTDAILERVELCFGPMYSNVSFYIPKNPSVVGLPEANGQSVVVNVNGRRVFTGYLTKRTNIYSSQDLKVSYTALSTLWDYAKQSVCKVYNEPRGKSVRTISNTAILADNNCPTNIKPVTLYGKIDVSNSTKLELMETMARYSGNFKIYTDSYGNTSFYRVGNPKSSRKFEIGRHILDYRMSKNTINKVNKVCVYSDYEKITTCITPLGVSIDEREGYMEFTVSANQISDIHVYALVNEQPRVLSFLQDLEVLPFHVYRPLEYSLSVGKSISQHEPGFESEFDTGQYVGGQQSQYVWPDGSAEPKFSVRSYQTFDAVWKPVGATVEYSKDGNSARVKISPIPIQWYSNILYKTAQYIVIKDGEPCIEYFPVALWFPAYSRTASIKVVYTYQSARYCKCIGEGTPSKCYFSEAAPYQILGVPSELHYRPELPRSNTDIVQSYLNDKATAEFERLNRDEVEGSITVLGDETLDLTSKVNGYQVVRIVHNFTRGFTTQLDITNEQFYRGEAILRQQEVKEVRDITNRNRSNTYRILYNLTKLEELVGALKDSPTTKEPKGGSAYYAD